jgi:hypothetical protein
MQQEVSEFVAWVRQELARAAQEGWQERLQEALVRLPPTPLARAAGGGCRGRSPRRRERRRRVAGSIMTFSGKRDGGEQEEPEAEGPSPARGRSPRARELARQPERLHPRHREVQAPRRRGGEGARPAHPRRRPGGPRPAGGGQPALRRPLREALPRPRDVLHGPHPRGEPRPHRGGQALRPRAQRQVHLLRGVVGAAGDLPRPLRARARLPPAPEALRPGLAAGDGPGEAQVGARAGPHRPRSSRRGPPSPGRRSSASSSPRGTTCRSRARWARTATSSSGTPSSRGASPRSRWR